MDALDLLKNQHNRIRDLLNEAETSSTEAQRKILLTQLISQLELHLELEDRFFYPILSQMDGLASQVSAMKQEHQSMVRLAQDLKKSIEDESAFSAKVQELFQLIDQHFEHEEQDLFLDVREEQGISRLQNLRKQMEAAMQSRKSAA